MYTGCWWHRTGPSRWQKCKEAENPRVSLPANLIGRELYSQYKGRVSPEAQKNKVLDQMDLE
jgi:hypothetical protein